MTSTEQDKELRGKIYSTLKSNYGDGEPGEEAILRLIRTEKLKLLAEVRERVVGKDVDLTAEHIRKSFTSKEIPLLMANSQLRKEQREALTKLEAEL